MEQQLSTYLLATWKGSIGFRARVLPLGQSGVCKQNYLQAKDQNASTKCK
jgi:hypothetical protein